MVISSCAQTVLRELDEKMIGIEEQKRQLKEVFRRWIDTGKGDSCLIMGHRGTGRTSIVEELLTTETADCDEVEKHLIFISQLGSDATAQSAVSGDSTVHRVIVIEDADELISRHRQTLLYSFLDSTRRNPWLVLLMVNRIDFVSCLEKRVRSRLSTNRIVFSGPQTYEDFLSAFHHFMSMNGKGNKHWTNFIRNLIMNREVQSELKYIYQVHNSYGLLKTILAVFLGFLCDANDPVEEALILWKATVASTVPSVSPVVKMLNGISLRTFCVFLCVLRRLEKAPAAATISYGKILVDYKHLCNTADKRMLVADDSIIFKELDQLVKSRLLFAVSHANNISFRRVSLNSDGFVLADAVKTRSIPMDISEWYKTIPVN